MKNQFMCYFIGKIIGWVLQIIQDIVSIWVLVGDNNDLKMYVQDVVKWMGVLLNIVLNFVNLEIMVVLMQLMVCKEGYLNWNSLLVYQVVGGSFNQQIVINVYGVNNFQEVVNLIVDKQGVVNVRVVQ